MPLINRVCSSLVVVLLVLASLIGCGYRFSVEGPGPRIGGGSAPRDEGPSVRLAIQDVANRTFYRDLESAYTDYMRQEFAVGSGAQVVAEAAQADYVIKGEIVSVTVPSLTFSTAQIRESRVHAVVRVTVERRLTGSVLWTKTATGTGEFFVNRAADVEGSQDVIQFNQVLQDRALEQAGQEAMERLAAAFWHAWDQGTFSSAQPSSSRDSSSTSLRERSAAPVVSSVKGT